MALKWCTGFEWSILYAECWALGECGGNVGGLFLVRCEGVRRYIGDAWHVVELG